MAERILTLRELNRATLVRQLLLDRVSLPAIEAIERLVGLQAQKPNPPYIGLWTRLRSFHRNDLTRLLEDGQVVRATMMRSTLHLMTIEDYVVFRPVLQPALSRALYSFFGERAKGIDVEPFVDVARAYVQEQPRMFAEIRAKLVELFPEVDPALMAYAVRTQLPLVQVPPGGTWDFTGSPAHIEPPFWPGRPLVDSSESLHLLVLRYLIAFGPATVKDVQMWSGLNQLQGIIEKLRPNLCTFRDEQGNELFDLPDSPLPSANVTAPPRFLPEFDNLVLSHADRRRVLPQEYRTLIVLPPGRVQATFLVDGFVRGIWKIERVHDVTRLVIMPFAPLPDSARDGLIEEGERLMRFVVDSAEAFEIQFA